MKTRLRTVCLVLLLISSFIAAMTSSLFAGEKPPATRATPSDQTEVRSAVQHIFEQLKAGKYEALYDSLPSSTRARMTRDRFVAALQNTRNLYQLDRIEIGAVRVSGDLAVVDTVMYARIAQPFNADGKLVVQQYLVREDGSWRVATGDRATIDRFLKSNPSFARRFPIKRPRPFIKQNGQWVEFQPPARKPST
ncbi:MAG TPA: hypothetical protein VHD88_02110 [Pyrinomonadaceae bacterium]|nr:hypothetical protein [Pyrinomonadaceae bacterium]